MLATQRTPAHPGEILREEYLKPMGLSQVAFAAHVGIPLQRVNEIVRGRRGVSPRTAWLFSAALGTTPEFWLNLQGAHDLATSRPTARGATPPARLVHARSVQRKYGATAVKPPSRLAVSEEAPVYRADASVATPVVIVLSPEVAEVFPDSASVNEALRTLMRLRARSGKKRAQR